MGYIVGEPVEIPIELRVPATPQGTPTDPTALPLKVRAPSGAIETYEYGVDPEVKRLGEGSYVATIVPNEPGEWLWEYRPTGAAEGILSGAFLVDEAIDDTDRFQRLVAGVGAILRSRTVSDFEHGGRRLGTFTETTTPTRGQVVELLADAARDLEAEIGALDELPEATKPLADSVLKLAGAMLVELNFPTGRSGDTVYDRLERRYDKRLMALKQAVKEAGAGDKIGSSDDAVLPVWSFPCAPDDEGY